MDYLSRGLCNRHYKRWQKWGDPYYDGTFTVPERFWPKVQKSDGCWTWIGALDPAGYGAFNDGERIDKAFIGAKPQAWVEWVLDALGYDPTADTVDDLFPGSGAVGAALAQGRIA